MDLTVATRPVRPDDLGRFLRLWPRLSPQTRYRRFHAPVDRLPMTAVHRFVAVDHDLREAVVAVVGGEVVGVARYDRSPDDPASAEFAVVVEDGWQGVGIGRQLLGDVLDRAARSGVQRLTATVQPDNAPVIGLVRRLLPRATLRPADGVLEVSSPLAAPASAVPPRNGVQPACNPGATARRHRLPTGRGPAPDATPVRRDR